LAGAGFYGLLFFRVLMFFRFFEKQCVFLLKADSENAIIRGFACSTRFRSRPAEASPGYPDRSAGREVGFFGENLYREFQERN